MENKTCTVCKIEKLINNFYKKYSECKECNNKRCVKRYYDIKDKISIQQKTILRKNREKLIQKQYDYRNKRNSDFQELLETFVEFENRLKAMEENLEIVSEIKSDGFLKNRIEL